MIRNEKAITLIELLAALSLSGIVLALITSVLFNSLALTEKTQEQSNIQQEANIVITYIEQAHKNNDNYDITIETADNKTMLLIAGQQISLMNGIYVSLDEFLLEYRNNDGTLIETPSIITATNKTYTSIDSNYPLYVNLTLRGTDGYSLQVRTGYRSRR